MAFTISANKARTLLKDQKFYHCLTVAQAIKVVKEGGILLSTGAKLVHNEADGFIVYGYTDEDTIRFKKYMDTSSKGDTKAGASAR